MDVISYRTPEGDPGRCAVRGHDCRLDPSRGRLATAPARRAATCSFGSDDRAAATDAQKVLLRVGKARFGPPSDEARKALNVVESRADQATLVDRLMTASS